LIKLIQQKFGFSCISQNNYLRSSIPANTDLYYKLERKVQNLRRKNIISYCIDDPKPPYKGVRGKGKVKIHEDINHNRPIIEKIIIRSTGSLEHPMAKWACIEIDRVREDIFAKLPERKNGRNLACR
jgi:hypothetical protein